MDISEDTGHSPTPMHRASTPRAQGISRAPSSQPFLEEEAPRNPARPPKKRIFVIEEEEEEEFVDIEVRYRTHS
jgi:hypothetical protein